MKPSRYQTGLFAESLCRLILRLKFYRILATRYKTPMGEIDIIAARGRKLVAVEVKSRPSLAQALESISPRQCRRIASALEIFVMRTPRYQRADLRFDVMAVMPGKLPVHLKNAWQVEDSAYKQRQP